MISHDLSCDKCGKPIPPLKTTQRPNEPRVDQLIDAFKQNGSAYLTVSVSLAGWQESCVVGVDRSECRLYHQAIAKHYCFACAETTTLAGIKLERDPY